MSSASVSELLRVHEKLLYQLRAADPRGEGFLSALLALRKANLLLVEMYRAHALTAPVALGHLRASVGSVAVCCDWMMQGKRRIKREYSRKLGISTRLNPFLCAFSLSGKRTLLRDEQSLMVRALRSELVLGAEELLLVRQLSAFLLALFQDTRDVREARLVPVSPARLRPAEALTAAVLARLEEERRRALRLSLLALTVGRWKTKVGQLRRYRSLLVGRRRRVLLCVLRGWCTHDWRCRRFREMQREQCERVCANALSMWRVYLLTLRRYRALVARSSVSSLARCLGKWTDFCSHNFDNRIRIANTKRMYVRTGFWCLRMNVRLEKYAFRRRFALDSALSVADKACLRLLLRRWTRYAVLSAQSQRLNELSRLAMLRLGFGRWTDSCRSRRIPFAERFKQVVKELKCGLMSPF